MATNISKAKALHKATRAEAPRTLYPDTLNVRRLHIQILPHKQKYKVKKAINKSN